MSAVLIAWMYALALRAAPTELAGLFGVCTINRSRLRRCQGIQVRTVSRIIMAGRGMRIVLKLRDVVCKCHANFPQIRRSDLFITTNQTNKKPSSVGVRGGGKTPEQLQRQPCLSAVRVA
jgi:hypothetical protein